MDDERRPRAGLAGQTDASCGPAISGLPEDVAATIYDKLGINRHQPLYTPQDRPVFLAHKGQPIGPLF